MIIGVESCCAIWMPADALVAPGPRVTKQTPGRPVALPTASAIMAAPPSWRQTVTVMPRRCVDRLACACALSFEVDVLPRGALRAEQDEFRIGEVAQARRHLASEIL